MSLINRVSAFFLAALAIALVGYSAAFYVLVRSHLYGQFDDGLQNALRILAASVEVEIDDAKWQPGEFAVDLDREGLRDVHWVVTDEGGQAIDHSPGFSRLEIEDASVFAYAAEPHTETSSPVEVGDWRVLQKQLDARQPKPIELREPHEFAGVRVTVARSPRELETNMRQLALIVSILPVGVWLVAAAAGRWYFRRALEPLQAMAVRARSMTTPDFSMRLPISTSRDELVDLGSAFNGLLDQLQAAYQREHRFTGDAAHQLRTPLTVLQGQIDVALRRPRQSAEYEQTLAVLSEQVAEFRQIVESLLFLARSEGTAVAPDVAPIAVDDWLAEYIERWNTHPRRGDIDVVADSRATILGSPPLLDQLLDNLVGNALKYSEAGSPIKVRAEIDGNRVAISVADRGIGVAREDRAAIFDPFFRAAEARQAGVAGTGLGLAVATRIAAALGGAIECESTPGRGSTFRVLLPLTSPSASATAVPAVISQT